MTTPNQMAEALAKLIPCPFCGGGQTEIRENGRMWGGMKYSEPTSASVFHHCDKPLGQPHRAIERVGRDLESAIEAWNMRAAHDAQPSAELPPGSMAWQHSGDATVYAADELHAFRAAGVAEAKAEIEALRADADRYRWLRDNTDSDWAICEWSRNDPDGIGYYRDARASNIVDAAIDAARKGTT